MCKYLPEVIIIFILGQGLMDVYDFHYVEHAHYLQPFDAKAIRSGS